MTNKNNHEKENLHLFSKMWISIFLILILLILAVFIGYGMGYKDGYFIAYNEPRFNLNGQDINAESLKYEYNKLNDNYNDLIEEYNQQNQKITVYQNGLISCGIDFKSLLN